MCVANSCPVIASYSVNTSRAAVGQRVELRATARDDDADDLTMEWTTTLGRFVNPHTGNTSYTCSVPGMAQLSLVVADSSCDTSLSVDIECTP